MDEVFIHILPGFTAWKLHTPKQYLLFLLLAATGIFVFRFIIKRMKSSRTPEKAAERVRKMLWKSSGKQVYFFTAKEGMPSYGDLIAVLPTGILLLKIYHKGYRIHGHLNESTWRISDNASSEIVPNPLRELEPAAEELKRALDRAGCPSFPIHFKAVFADNYAEPTFYTEEEVLPFVTTTAELEKETRKEMKKQAEKQIFTSVKRACRDVLIPDDRIP
jgi:hypothetical protein